MDNLEISVARSILEKMYIKFGNKVSLIDCGSNEGKFTTSVSDLIDHAILIEAIPALCESLSTKFSQFDVYNFAVCRDTGSGVVYTPDDQYSKTSLNKRPAFINELKSKKIVETTITKNTLKDILANNQKYNEKLWYLKMDVEGYELDAIDTIDIELSKRIVGGQFEYGGCWRERNISLLTMVKKLISLDLVPLMPVMTTRGIELSLLQYQHDTYEHTNFFFLSRDFINLDSSK
jgi:FkbM family methyltransferase